MKTILIIIILLSLNVNAQTNKRIPIFDFDANSASAIGLDNIGLVNSIVDVKFTVNQYGQTLEKPEYIRQRVSAIHEMDGITNELINEMKIKSGTREQTFIETAGWLIYTTNGEYKSEVALGSNASISTNKSEKVLYDLIKKIIKIEGHFIIEDVEFFHTHLFPGEAFNRGDVESHEVFLGDLLSEMQKGIFKFNLNSFASHAVPVLGKTFFSYKNEWP